MNNKVEKSLISLINSINGIQKPMPYTKRNVLRSKDILSRMRLKKRILKDIESGDSERCENCEVSLPYSFMYFDREGIAICPACYEEIKNDDIYLSALRIIKNNDHE